MRIVPLLFLLLICTCTRAQLLDAIALDTVRTYRSLERALEDPMRVYKLDLSKQKLKELPEELRRLPNLNSLDLGHNKLKTLPEWISEFAHLQEFSANNNRMVNFPESICALRHLKRLDMSRNALISLPAGLGRHQRHGVLLRNASHRGRPCGGRYDADFDLGVGGAGKQRPDQQRNCQMLELHWMSPSGSGSE